MTKEIEAEADADFERVTLRIPKWLHLKVNGSRAHLGRSMNSEIIERLASTYPPEPLPMTDADIDKLAVKIVSLMKS